MLGGRGSRSEPVKEYCKGKSEQIRNMIDKIE
jgi:hypothetical protein